MANMTGHRPSTASKLSMLAKYFRRDTLQKNEKTGAVAVRTSGLGEYSAHKHRL